MRLIIFVPPARGAIRTWRSVAYGADRLGHTVFGDGPANTSAEVRAILDAKDADMVACRPRHIDLLDPDLHIRALPIPTVRGYRAAAASVVGLPWLVGRIRRHRTRIVAAAALAGLAGVVAAVLLAPHGDDEQQQQQQQQPGAVAPPPRPSPTQTTSPGHPPATAPTTRPPGRPSNQPNAGRRVTGTVWAPRPTATRPPTPTLSATPPRSPTVAPTGSPTPTPTPPAEEQQACILRLRLLGVLDVEACLSHPSG